VTPEDMKIIHGVRESSENGPDLSTLE